MKIDFFEIWNRKIKQFTESKMVSLPENITQSIHNDLINILIRDPVRIELMHQIRLFGNLYPFNTIPYALKKLDVGTKTDDECFAKQYWNCNLAKRSGFLSNRIKHLCPEIKPHMEMVFDPHIQFVIL